MSDQQAYRSTGGTHDGNDEWNRLHAAARSIMNQMATATLVRVVAVNGRSVDVQPMVAQLDGAGNAVPHGTIHNLPVWRNQAAGVAIVVTPAVGDVGLAVFAHSDISSAKATGADSPPGSKRRFDWADGIYLGGLFGPDEPATTITLSEADGLVITSALPVRINAPLQALQGLTVMGGLTVDGKPYALHTHSGVAVGTAVSGPVAP